MSYLEEVYKIINSNDLVVDISCSNIGNYEYELLLKPERVIFNDPATIVMWNDGSKTIIKCQPGDTFDKEKGLAMAYVKRFHNNSGSFNDIFKKWIREEY